MAESTYAPERPTEQGLVHALVGDGRPLLLFTGLALLLSGGFALFLAATGQFLPHDVAFLGMQPQELCAINECRIVHFMIHDRVAFGGALIAVAVLYLWLAAFPLRQGEAWAWWAFAVSGTEGFLSFLAYLSYGYLDTWHGMASFILLPLFVAALTITRRSLPGPVSWRLLLVAAEPVRLNTRSGLGRSLLLLCAAGMIVGGMTILAVGATVVFVPQDLEFMGLATEELRAINPRLIPLIAHDRAGFGGAVMCTGILIAACVWCGRPSRAWWQALALAGGAGFSTAIFVHPAIGYTDFIHLLPAILGAVAYMAGLLLCMPQRSAAHA